MKRIWIVLMITAVFVLTLTLAIGAYAQEVKVGAGAAPTNSVLKPVKESFEKATGIKLTIIESGPKIALQDLHWFPSDCL